MNEFEIKSRVYALIFDDIITRIEGEYSLPNDLEGWTLIEEGIPCDRLNLAQSHYLEKGLTTFDGIYQYKYINGEVVERTEEEIEADRNNVPTPEPSAEEVRFTEIEDALIEVSEMVVENETDTNALAVQIAEIQDALVELAEIITGE